MPAVDALPALVVSGPPASGKSTVGRALARRLHAAVLDQDVLTAPLTAVIADLLGEDDLDAPALSAATRAARYETVLAAAEDNLRAGRPVVLVAPLTHERRDPAAWATLAGRLRRAGGDPVLVWLTITAERLTERMRDRSADRDAGKLSDLGAFVSSGVLEPPRSPAVVVDATQPTDAQCALVLDHLGAREVS